MKVERWGKYLPLAMLAMATSGCVSLPTKISGETQSLAKSQKSIPVVVFQPTPIGGDGWNKFTLEEATGYDLDKLATEKPYKFMSDVYEKLDLDDPAEAAAREVVREFDESGELTNLQISKPEYYWDHIPMKERTQYVSQKYNSDLVLNVLGSPTNGLFRENLFALNDSYLWYGARFELVDTTKKEMIWYATCDVKIHRPEGKESPKSHELINNNQKILREWQSQAASQCADQVLVKFGETTN